jgi:hypothetical protein
MGPCRGARPPLSQGCKESGPDVYLILRFVLRLGVVALFCNLLRLEHRVLLPRFRGRGLHPQQLVLFFS